MRHGCWYVLQQNSAIAEPPPICQQPLGAASIGTPASQLLLVLGSGPSRTAAACASECERIRTFPHPHPRPYPAFSILLKAEEQLFQHSLPLPQVLNMGFVAAVCTAMPFRAAHHARQTARQPACCRRGTLYRAPGQDLQSTPLSSTEVYNDSGKPFWIEPNEPL